MAVNAYDLLGRIKERFLLMEHGGHGSTCNAVKGPENETWTEPKDCDCGLNKILEDIDIVRALK